MKYARISGDVVCEVWDQRPVLHPGVEIVETDDGVLAGWVKDGDGDIEPPDKPELFEKWDKTAGAYIVDASARDAARREEIKIELEALDRFLPRSVEDLLDAGAVTSDQFSTENQERRARKLALRAELNGLQL
jgi:hypothetical protein